MESCRYKRHCNQVTPPEEKPKAEIEEEYKRKEVGVLKEMFESIGKGSEPRG